MFYIQTQNGATRRSGHRAPRPFNGLRRSTPPALSCRRARKNKIVQSFIAQRPPSPQRSSFGRPRPTPIPLPDHPTVDSGKIKLYKVLLRSAPSRISPSPDNFPATTTLPIPHPNPRGGSVAPPPPPAHSTTPIPASRAARRRPRLLPRPFSSSRAGRSGCHQGSCPPGTHGAFVFTYKSLEIPWRWQQPATPAWGHP